MSKYTALYTSPSVQYSLCQCGCGKETPIAQRSNKRLGYIKGKHYNFCPGHRLPKRIMRRWFWEKVAVGHPNECWPWLGIVNKLGYGMAMRHKGRDVRAHRVAFEINYGPISKGKFVCHTCDNPSCCNPTHLFEGTPMDNMRDMIVKGRKRAVGHKGALNPYAKLNEADVKEIRSLAGSGLSYAEIGRRYYVSGDHISRIVRHQAWTHVT